MPKENGKIRSEYLLAALMCIAVAFFLTILIVSKSCSADLSEEGSSSSDLTSSEVSSKPSVSSAPSSVQNTPAKVENVPLGSPAKVTEGILAPTTDIVLDPDAENAGAPADRNLANGGALVKIYNAAVVIYHDEKVVPFQWSGTGLYLREDATNAFIAMAAAYNDKKQVAVDKAYLSTESGFGEAVDKNLATGCAVLLLDYATSSEARTWLADNCTKYGYILRYPAEKAEFTHQTEGNSLLFRYVGYEHAAYMGQYHFSLEEYLEALRSHTVDNPLEITYTDANGDERSCEVYFVPVTGGETAELPIRGGEGTEFTYTGNGSDGIIVTCYSNGSGS